MEVYTRVQSCTVKSKREKAYRTVRTIPYRIYICSLVVNFEASGVADRMINAYTASAF